MDHAGQPIHQAERHPRFCSVELVYSDRVNFAMQQNGVPLVDSVRITSRHPQSIEGLTIELLLDNAEAEPWTGRIERLAAGATVALSPDGFSLSAKQLATRTEAERTSITCRVSADSLECRSSFPVDLLTYDQWPGVGHYPELTGAFVTPNHPKIAGLLRVAREAMQGLSDSDALDGYQSASRQRASLLAEACFNAVASQGLGYINPPASFEVDGQRVRLIDRLTQEGLATCLDLSLLLMSLWEQCGLHSLILLPRGHAMPAVWTHDAHLPEVVIDEPARVRNLIELGEVIPVESTHLTQPGSTYAGAVAAAKQHMGSLQGMFHAIDIRSARKRKIRPLPLREDGQSGVAIDALAQTSPSANASSTIDRVALAEKADRRIQTDLGPADEETSGRVAQWQTRLLDLSLRNRLLHFKSTGRSIRIDVPDLGKLEDSLASGDPFELLPRSDADEHYLREEQAAKRLYTQEPTAETQKRLLNLYRLAKSSIEETGANVLYLALGMLKWYESDNSEQARYAPLILLPITLVRSSGGTGYRYVLKLSEEPLRPNVTLLEKLRVQFGIETEGLDDLPEDESGIDVELILRNFRAAIRDTARWEVVETAAIGLFSFNKFLMWKDLKENLDRLMQNRLVRHLVDRPEQAFDQDPFPQAEELDEQLQPDDLLCTRDADSSQLAAVRAAADRCSFVLEGPPGTGKSQTIANIVADTLSRGRTVLFVAEKMAALSVVRKRLEDDGLGPFCLELHSAKASKKEVLSQLEQALSTTANLPPAGWETHCRDLRDTRDQLNRYVREMHKPRGTGESLYKMLGRLALIGEGPSAAPPTSAPAAATAEQLADWKRAIASVQESATPVDPVCEAPLRGIGQSAWSYTLPDKAREAVDAGLQARSQLQEAADAFVQRLGLDIGCTNASQGSIKALAYAAADLQKCPCPPSGLIYANNAAALRQRAAEAVSTGRERETREQSLLTRYHQEFLSLDYLAQIDAIERHLNRPGIVRLFTAGAIKKTLRAYAKAELPALAEVVKDLEQLREINRLSTRIQDDTELASVFGPLWGSEQCDWSGIEKQIEWAGRFNKVLALLDSDQAIAGVSTALATVAASEEQLAGLKSSTRPLIEAWNGWHKAWGQLHEVLSPDLAQVLPVGSAAWLDAIGQTLQRWSANLGGLNAWCAWRSARDKASEMGLGDLVQLYEAGRCTRSEIDSVFWRSFGKAWFTAIADSIEAIRAFNIDKQTNAIDRFRKLDRQFIDLTRHIVSARVKQAAPADNPEASAQSEIGVLRREIQKKSRHLPTRRLIESMPTLLPRLKPCFLMSPLSVAQFLDARLPPFDVVVFDEASQIPVWDAVGAIARGSEVIVVGDSKQLPPTAFFSTLDNDDDHDSEDHAVDDMESILKECNASGIPGMRLRWHYRSRHESLIAFSNHHYYQNELHTFPSPEDRSEQLGVTFQHVPDGVYDRGGSRTNRIEAQRVVDEVVRMLRDQQSTDSIGIVTFNQAQQSLIEDLLDERRRELPEIEPYFTNEVSESVFVKNLENVQGDERDAIIFSVGYGPDQAGKLSVNFGPLNKEGGERRLNVAVTRARRQLIVFASMTSDQIDLRTTRAVGVHHFKTFLDYANRGPQAIAEAVSVAGAREFDSGFEKAVHNALTARGWDVDTQVGCAGYRIDLGVRNPDKPGKYLLGIECDGASYHSAKTARDRDRLRQSVLEGLGWRIERVWSTDWFVNPQGCVEKLVRAIEAAWREPEPLTLPEDKPVDPAGFSADDENTSEQGDPRQTAEAPDPEHELYARGPSLPASEPTAPAGPPAYVAASTDNARLAAMDIYEAAAKKQLALSLKKIVETESPITIDLAMRRLAETFGVQRLTARCRKRFNQIITAAKRSGDLQAPGDVLWKPGQDPASYDGFRVPGDDPSSQRDIENIPLVELANAAAWVLQTQFGMPRDELVREIARQFGIRRITARISEHAEEAVEQILREGTAQEVEGQVRPAAKP